MEPALLELYAEGVPDDEVAVILRLTDPAVIPDGVRIVARFGLIATCRVRRGDIPRLWAERSVESVKRPRPYGPTLDESEDLAEADVDLRPSDVRRPEGLRTRGKNVAVAHIDWGVDFRHADFRNDDGSTRLLAIWDQAAPVDPNNPNPYGYGRIHRQADINRALATADPYAALNYWPAASDPAGIGSHGTHTLGISTGNGRSGGPLGLAPDSDQIFVHFSTSTNEGPVLLGDSVAFLEALDLIAKVADWRRLVVNASLGRQCGQHDGQTLTERGMDAFLRAADGRAICFSAGNYYSRDMHTEGLLRPGEHKTFRFALDPSYGGTNEIDLWYPGLDRFGIAVTAPDGSRVSAAPDGRAVVTVDGRAVGRLYHRIGDPNNGDNQVSLFLDPGAPRDVWRIELNGVDVADGRFHAWIERTAGGARRHARFLPEDIDRTCTTGTICNGHWTIATGAYDRHQASRPLARFSSSGPTRDGRPKPDLLAPGVRVLSARSHPRNATGDASLLTRMSGTSMAAPHVAGTVALMFAAAPRPLSVAETRRLLLGSVDPPTAADGDERWRMGSGFLDTRAAVEAAASLAGLGESVGGEAVEPAESEPVAASAIAMVAQAEASEALAGETASADEMAPEDIDMADELSDETASDEATVESDAEGIAIENLAAAESDAEAVAVEAAPEEIDEAQASEDLEEEILEADGPAYPEQMDEQSQEQEGETADVLEASMADKRSQFRRRRRAGGSALPFQVQVPLTGGSPGLAFPIGGGAGSPLAFTVPLGGTPAPPPQPQPPVQPQPVAPATAAAGAVPAGDAPLPVGGDVPLYEPPTGTEFDEAEWIGEGVLEAADEAALNDDGRRLSSSSLLQNLVQNGLGVEDPIGLSPLGPGRPGPSATALFRALAYADDTGWRDALQRHYRSRFAVLARPGDPCSIMPRPGDLLIRCARGEGWATLAVVASPGLYRHHELPALGLRAEGYPRVRPGLYVHVVEPGPRPYPSAARFARRLGDIGSTTLGDTLLLRLRPSGSFGEAEPATPANGVPAKELRSGASGAAVRDVQAQLNRVHADLVALGLPGLEGGPLTEDGRFTARMERMVQAFQQTVFNDPGQWDGVVRSDTLAELRKLTGAAATSAPAPAAAPVFPPLTSMPAPSPAPELEESDFAEGSGPTFVRWIQASLNRVMNAGLTEDGQMGPRTRTAIRAFQQRAGLVADGVVGPRTEAALRAAVEGQSGGGAAAPTAVCRGIAARDVIDHFEFNHPEMPASGQPTIDNIAACIAESRRGSDPIRTIRLVGHTDSVGTDADNDRLGTNRANSVRDALRTALHGHGIADADVVIVVETRGERDLLPGDPALSRRVEIFPPRAFTPTAAAAQIEVVLDDNNDTIVDAAAPVTTFVRFGLWDRGYDGTGNVRNGQAETANFIGQDRRRFYLRVRDPAATTPRVNATWRTLQADGRTDDDAPASQAITLTETASGSHVYVSKAIMLVTDDTDANQSTHSGLAPPLADANVRTRGQSNHRLRRASMNGFLFAQYVPASGTAVTVTLPVFVRTPNDERRRVRVRVINYNTSATAAYIAGQFDHANLRWNQIGIAIQAQATVNRAAPAGVIGADGTYAGEINNAPETAALNDLVPITPNNTVTAVFVPLSGANAYATIGQRTTVALGDRYFIFIDDSLSLNDETLAHELAHVLFNRFDGTTARRFYTLNTNAPSGFGVALPDPRIYRRIQNQHSADPDNDAPNDNIVNWARRLRGARFPIGGDLDPPTATTGNKLTETL